jgi:MFS-type transporter involved in bile tolerance (Atg22 family)
LLAFALLAAHADLEHVFLASAVPGLIVVLLLVLGLPSAPPAEFAAPTRFSWKGLHGRLRAMIVAAGLLALSSVPEVFVVLWATQSGLEATWVPLVWAAASAAKMLIALPAGILSDRIGRIPLLLGGWTLRVLVLLLLAWATPGDVGVWLLFMAYSATLAVTEPAERSVIGDHATPGERGTAFGLYHLASGLLVLPGALVFGLAWERFGSSVAFTASAVVTAAAAVLMITLASVRDSGAPRVP